MIPELASNLDTPSASFCRGNGRAGVVRTSVNNHQMSAQATVKCASRRHGGDPATEKVAFILIEATALEFWRQDRCVLDRFSIHCGAAEAVHVVGDNGAGKTTLLRLLAGLVWPEAGDLRFRGEAYATARPKLHRELCFIGHGHGMSGDLTAFDNLRHWAVLYTSANAAAVESALDAAGVGDCRHRVVRSLSAGQKRRVALARLCLAQSLPLWMLDEPWTHLDRDGSAWALNLIDEHVRRGGTVLFSAHADLGRHPHGYRVVPV